MGPVELMKHLFEGAVAEGNVIERLDPECDPRDGVSACVAELKVDMVVCGSRGQGALQRAFLGSVSTDIVSTSPCAVTVVHIPPKPEKPFSFDCFVCQEGVASPPTSPLMKITSIPEHHKYLLCVDGSNQTIKVIQFLSKLLNDGDQVVVYCGVRFAPVTPETHVVVNADCLKKAAENIAAMSKQRLDKLIDGRVKVQVEIDATQKGTYTKPREYVVEYADTHKVDTIVCGTVTDKLSTFSSAPLATTWFSTPRIVRSWWCGDDDGPCNLTIQYCRRIL
eukprot:NODE_3244_length_1252_cov_141.470328_g3080_i0.p1 GENE.NODE_3244_length_1252_cov_141.470328_g3080_i0~~NODE_3244_length_1252_cov_141.470328_g3080_i0.p1  ORF type:complete len:279 (-),score=42.32 NODE_3244_length_1252_cov_141.470328_g3080_i0:225-1061(-)